MLRSGSPELECLLAVEIRGVSGSCSHTRRSWIDFQAREILRARRRSFPISVGEARRAGTAGRPAGWADGAVVPGVPFVLPGTVKKSSGRGR
jgi:hypothetical protein